MTNSNGVNNCNSYSTLYLVWPNIMYMYLIYPYRGAAPNRCACPSNSCFNILEYSTGMGLAAPEIALVYLYCNPNIMYRICPYRGAVPNRCACPSNGYFKIHVLEYSTGMGLTAPEIALVYLYCSMLSAAALSFTVLQHTKSINPSMPVYIY